MNPLVFWNELSEQPVATSKESGKERMDTVVDTLAALRMATIGFPAPRLRSHTNLHGTFLAENYTIADWQVTADKDRRQLFLHLQTSSPLLRTLEGPEALARFGCAECHVGEATALGLRAAWAFGELSISLDSDDPWRKPWIDAQIDILEDSGVMLRQPGSIRHLAYIHHIDEHKDWLEKRVLESVADGRDLWERRLILFPSLDFCTEVERQLRSFDAGSHHLRNIIDRLFALERAATARARDALRAPIGPDFLPYKCTPETPQTLKDEAADHTATLPNGHPHLFKWHIRFTPGGGRLFFDIDESTGRGMVGYIGLKKNDRLT